MSGRPDHAAARWAENGVEEADEAPPTGGASAGAGSPDVGSPDAETVDPPPAGAETVDGGPAAGPILTDVVALTAQRDEYLESLQRLKADFDNYRKRVARLQQEQSARAEANLVTRLLPVLDNLDLAWAHLGPRDGSGEPASEEARALGQARAQVLDLLGKEGLERVDAAGVPFDPTVHDAVAHAEAPAESSAGTTGTDDGSAGHGVSVDEVLRAGYRWRGQVLRPAMVRVRG